MVKLLPPNLREPLQAVILKHLRDKQFDMESQRISMHRVLLVAMGIQHAPQLSAMVAPLGIVRFYELPMLRVARVEAYLFLQEARRRQWSESQCLIHRSRASVPGPEHRPTLFQRSLGRALLKIWTIFLAYVSLNFQDIGLLVPDLQYLDFAIRQRRYHGLGLYDVREASNVLPHQT